MTDEGPTPDRDGLKSQPHIDRGVRPRISSKAHKAIRLKAKNPLIPAKDLAEKAGYANEANVRRALRSNTVQAAFQEYLLNHPGVQFSDIAGVIADGMKATKKVRAMWEGKFTDSEEEVDHQMRLAAASLAAKLGKLEPARQNEVSAPGGAPLFPQIKGPDLSGLSKEQLLAILDVKDVVSSEKIEDATVIPPENPQNDESPADGV